MTLHRGKKVYLVKNPNQIYIVISKVNSDNDNGFDSLYTITPEYNYELPNGVINEKENIIISEREVFSSESLK